MQYILKDSGDKSKLEQVGDYLLVRPSPSAFWSKSTPVQSWQNVHGIYKRNSSGGGAWTWLKKVPERWTVDLDIFKMIVKPTDFGHLGFFPEQFENWNWLKNTVSEMNKPSTINLFAYSGASSLAMASGGAEVCHVDAAKGMVDWARENLELNPAIPKTVRWIVDDVIKFIQREIRRGRKYNGLVLDPPSFGRGPQGQVWKMEDSIVRLLESCRDIIDTENSFFVLMSCHSEGFTPIALERLLADVFKLKDSKFFSSGEMHVPEVTGSKLPAGAFARLYKK